MSVFAVLAALAAGYFTRQSIDSEAAPAADITRSNLIASRGDVPGLSDAEFFAALTRLLRAEYVDPVTDDAKLAAGAVRGMVNRLADADAYFMSPKQFSAHRETLRGRFEGIGVELQFQYDAQQRKLLAERKTGGDPAMLIPRLVVTAVLPGSPADAAGLKLGDVIESVDGRWVLSADTVREFRARQREVNEGNLPPEALDDLRKKMREKARTGLSPAAARDRLTLGTEGETKVVWRRAGKLPEATIRKRATVAPGVIVRPDGVIVLKLFEGADRELGRVLAGKKSVTIDLRDSTRGDFATFRRALPLLAPTGRYGMIAKARPDAPPSAVRVEKGRERKLEKIRLIVDSSTRGAAQALAVALRDAGLATIEGSGMVADRVVTETVGLADGSGYVLPVGEFRTSQGGDR
jgi:carboxyl-terminal processing protease